MQSTLIVICFYRISPLNIEKALQKYILYIELDKNNVNLKLLQNLVQINYSYYHKNIVSGINLKLIYLS